ncbi:XRE family transcriptional regulator [Streptococcus acidominimus]|uniref:XRE family transcriptional regulator n=1 Tax=Streptococcus acidominimus TaxID=1326 RepID=UPI001F5ADDA3|nr:XRE family transcriptional regulator [Streptococcus acidominimus]
MELNIYIGQKIRDFRKLAGMNQTQLAEKLNTTKQTISRYEKGDRKAGQDTLFALCEIFDVSIDDFFPMVAHNQPSPNTSPEAPSELVQAINDTVVQLHPERQENVLEYATEQLEEQKKTTREIQEEPAEYNSDKIIAFPPKYDYDFYDSAVSAGTGQYLGEVQKETISLPIDVDADFVVPVDGRSMEPEYYTGDYVFVKLSVNLKDGDIGVFDYYGDAYIKQLVIDEHGAYLHSFNPEYPDMPIDADTDFRIIGEVVSVYREK